MIVLDTTTRSLEVLLGGAVTTNELQWVSDWIDINLTTGQPTSAGAPSLGNGLTNGTTAVTLIAAPAASTIRKAQQLHLYNADTAAAQVTVRLNDNGTFRTLVSVSLPVASTLVFDAADWSIVPDPNTAQLAAIAAAIGSSSGGGYFDMGYF